MNADAMTTAIQWGFVFEIARQVVGGIVLLVGVCWAVAKFWTSRSHAAQTDQPVVAPPVPKPLQPRKITDDLQTWDDADQKPPVSPRKRRADDPAPPGAVEWVADVCGAIDGAPADLILGVLKAGGSRESALIAERESRKPAPEPAA